MFEVGEFPEPGAAAGVLLAAVDPDTLDDEDLPAYLQACARQTAHAEAVQLDAIRRVAARTREKYAAQLSGDLTDRAAVHEVRLALRISKPAAERVIVHAGVLADLPATQDLLLRGVISGQHVRAVTDVCATVPVEHLPEVEEIALRRAATQTPGRLRHAFDRAIVAVDPAGAQQRRATATADLGVHRLSSLDGVGGLGIRLTDPDTEWAFTVLDTQARATRDGYRHHLQQDPDLTPSQVRDRIPGVGPLRSQAFLDILAAHVGKPGFPTEHGRPRTEVCVVVDLPTVLGLADNPALVNGRPVPGPVARAMAADAVDDADRGRTRTQRKRGKDGTGAAVSESKAFWRRLVTDPVRGHLLDYGSRYEPPTDLTDYVIARDHTCRGPGCTRRASASDLDHATPFPRGDTSSANLGALCRGEHTLKTLGVIDILDSRPDGSATWISPLGRRYQIPPRCVLDDPAPPLDPEPPPPPDEPIPF